jgi:hypothetical protein
MPKLYLGKRALSATWQEDFKPTEKCCRCGKKAKIMFTMIEEKEKEYVCGLYRTTGKKGSLWLHDAMACAAYLCPFCFEGTIIINQA